MDCWGVMEVAWPKAERLEMLRKRIKNIERAKRAKTPVAGILSLTIKLHGLRDPLRRLVVMKLRLFRGTHAYMRLLCQVRREQVVPLLDGSHDKEIWKDAINLAAYRGVGCNSLSLAANSRNTPFLPIDYFGD
jgi:hypothetical protein